ncbi:MAG: hypothetical protein HY064_11010 [Bacteroidetes bacterium]|nr:hypothetical protein [Bacteroidota bacterium]
MKKQLLLGAMILFTLGLSAQKIKISVDEKNMSIGGGSHNCLVVSVYDAKADDIMSKWRSKMKDYNAKVSGKDEIFADNALIKDISDNTCDVYARTEKGKDDNETQFIVGFVLGETWLSSSSNSTSYKAAEQIVKDFAVKMTKDANDDIVAAEQKKLEKIQSDQDDLVKKSKSLNDDITNYQAKIKKAQDDLKQNDDDQAKKKAELDAQQKIVDAAKARQNSVE